MIKTRFEMSEDGKSIILTLKGHSGYAEEGQDIVCSAASILAYTIAQNVMFYADRKMLKKKPTIKMASGDICITCKPTKDNLTEALLMFNSIATGYLLLAQSYPENIEVITFGQTAKV